MQLRVALRVAARPFAVQARARACLRTFAHACRRADVRWVHARLHARARASLSSPKFQSRLEAAVSTNPLTMDKPCDPLPSRARCLIAPVPVFLGDLPFALSEDDDPVAMHNVVQGATCTFAAC
eukprot:3853850-Pleurochrysis_carterae.AAC.1